MLKTSLRRGGAAIAAVAIGIPVLAVTTASAEPVLDPPLTAAAGTTWAEGPCAEGEGVTVVVDSGADAGDAVVRCVTNEDETAYSSDNALQTFADAGFDVETEATEFGPMICKVDGTPDPCGQWPGAWWSFWTGTSADGWTDAGAGAHATPAATDTFIGFALVAEDAEMLPPRVEITDADGTDPDDEEPGDEDENLELAAGITAAADFLARELQAQDHLLENWGFDDYGLTTDFALALASTGQHEDDARAAAENIASSITGYTGTDGEIYAGAVSKSLVLALTVGMDPTDFGGLDLIATLQDLETESGRFSDLSEWGDFSNALTQALAIMGLEGAGVGASQEAVDYLISMQCDDGGFTLNAGGTCLSDPDATSFALQALAASPCATDDAFGAGVAYLANRQQANGGFGGGTSTEGVNANSTGLAATIMAIAGLDDEAAAAAEFLLDLQFGEDFYADLHGAIAYDATVYGQREGATEVFDQDRRSTAQGVLGLTGVTFAELAGAFENAPERDCEVAPPTEEPTEEPTEPEPTEEPTEPEPTEPEPTEEPTAMPTTGPTAKPAPGLAQTGSEVAPIALLALLLVLAGGGAVALAARRGAHQ